MPHDTSGILSQNTHPTRINTAAAFLSSGFFLTHVIYPLSKGRFKIGRGCGLIGSLEALLLWLALPTMSFNAALLMALGLTLAGVWLADLSEKFYGVKDDSRIVIDEVVGYFWTLIFLPKTPVLLAASFALFRVLDVTKPLGIRKLEGLPGGWGCVADDMACGLASALILRSLEGLL